MTCDDNDDLQTVVDSEPLKVTPLPKFQLFIAIFIQVSEPVTCTVIYPFVNDLIRSLGINHGDETKTGYYVGVVVRTVRSKAGSLVLKRYRPVT